MKCSLLFLILLVFVSCRSSRTPGHHTRSSPPKKEISRFEQQLGISLPPDINRAYISAISEWIGVPYKYGGNTRNGTDCSGFVQSVYLKVFNKVVDHNSAALFNSARSIRKDLLKEGDLLFFRINGDKKISHVGMHITEDFFVHASTKKGVVISRVTEPYYKNTFAGYGSFR